MSRIALCPTLILLAGLAAAADRPSDIDRAVRVQEAGQRSIAGTTTATAKDLAELAEEIRCNQLGDAAEVAVIEASAAELSGLTDAQREKTMPWVQARLATARGAQAGGELGKASEAQTGLIKSLDQIVEKLARPATDSAFAALRDALAKQEKTKADTEKLAEQTLGKPKEELTTTEKAETERIADRQKQVEQAVKAAIDQLRDEAKSESDPQQKQQLEKAAEQLALAQAQQKADQAQQDISDNQLNQAQEKQQQVLDALTQAAQQAGMPEAQPPSDPAAMQEQLDQLAKLEQRQEDALAAAKQLDAQAPPQAAAQLQKTQQEIAQDLAQAQQQAAAAPAQQAAAQLPKSPAQAQQSMQQALAAIKQAKQELTAQLAQMPAPPMPSDMTAQKSDPKSKPLGKLEDGEKNRTARNGQWKVQLLPQEREVLATGAGEKFPERYEQALTAYYRALATGGGDQ